MRLTSSGLVAPTVRTIPPFDLRRPRSVDEAVADGSAPGAVYAAGCTDVIAQFRAGLACCDSLVSLEAVPGLRTISWDGTALRIGAAVDHRSGSSHACVAAALPGLAAAWGRLANPRVRRRATIGGNLMARRAGYEFPVILDAVGAHLRFAVPGHPVVLRPADIWNGTEPRGALLHTVVIPDARELWFGYDRSLRPWVTVAAAVRGRTVRLTVGCQALYEEMHHDGDGILMNGDLLAYRVPLAGNLPARFMACTEQQ